MDENQLIQSLLVASHLDPILVVAQQSYAIGFRYDQSLIDLINKHPELPDPVKNKFINYMRDLTTK